MHFNYIFISILLLCSITFEQIFTQTEKCGKSICPSHYDCCLPDPLLQVPKECCKKNSCCNYAKDESSRCCLINDDRCKKNRDMNICSNFMTKNSSGEYIIKQCTPDTGKMRKIKNPKFEIISIPVGQGDGTLIKCVKSQELFLVDLGCSGTKEGKMWKAEKLKEFIDSKGEVKKILVTHGDYDHYSYIPDVFNDTEGIDDVYIGGIVHDYGKSNMKDWLEDVEAKKLLNVLNSGKPCFKDECLEDPYIFQCDGESIIEVLAANLGHSTNEKCIVLKLQSTNGDDKEFSSYMSGDFEGISETDELIERVGKDIKDINVLKLAHHGAFQYRTLSNIPKLLHLLNPEMVYSSSAYINSYGHPRCACAFHLLNNTNTRILTTGNGEGEFEKLKYSCYDSSSGIKNRLSFDEWRYRIYSTVPTADIYQTINFEVDYNTEYFVHTELVTPENFMNREEHRKFLIWWEDFKMRMKNDNQN